MYASRLMSSRAAIETAEQTIRDAAIRGMRDFRVTTDESLSVEFQRGWTVGCTLYVRVDRGRRQPVHAARTRDVIDHEWIQTPRVEICWSSTERTVAAATAAIALYRDVVDLAALVEARLAEREIGWSEREAVESERSQSPAGEEGAR